MKTNEVVVVGGINLDIKGQSFAPLLPRTSNPGLIQATAGGVGRNIAENLARLKVAVTLLSVIGQDPEGEKVVQATEAVGVNVQHLLRLSDHKTGMYISFHEPSGEMNIGLSAMDILSRISGAYLESQRELLCNSGFIICDTNIPEEAIAFLIDLAGAARVPICIEPVSVAKAQKVKRHLNGITIITPNLDELAALTGAETGRENVAARAELLIAQGVQTVVTTMGESGICCTTREGSIFLESYPAKVANVTGAGDALTAGLIYGLVRQNNLPDSCKCGLAAAALAVASDETVSPAINPEGVGRIIREKG